MRPFHTLASVMFTSLFVIAYSEAEAEITAHDHAQQPTQITSTNSANEIAGMTLNNGEKWQLDEHTRFMLNSMKNGVSLEDIRTAPTTNLKMLGIHLQAQTNDLIQGCTMVGADHDQLHTFLTGYMPAVDELTETGSIESAKKIEHYLNNYSHYFE